MARSMRRFSISTYSMAIHAMGLMAVTMPMRFAELSTVRRTSSANSQ